MRHPKQRGHALTGLLRFFRADQRFAGSIRLLRARGRELSRNNPVAKNYLNLLANNVIGRRGSITKPRSAREREAQLPVQ